MVTPALPAGTILRRVRNIREIYENAAQILLLRAEDHLGLKEVLAAGERGAHDLTVVALADDEESGLAAVRRGADDWSPASDPDLLASTVKSCQARREFRRASEAGGAAGLDRGELVRELRGTRDATLRTVGLLLERRDLETKGHTDRVVAMAEHLAEYVGLTETERQAFRWGAYLHDIGKMALPDRILFKPGRLTPEEFALVRQHARIGFEMVAELPFLPAAACELVRHHHERWDGQGYPDNLSGDEIPLLARMFSMVDVYDALSSKRPYKPAWPREQALQTVREGVGSDFDPEMGAAFLEMMRSASSAGGDFTSPAG